MDEQIAFLFFQEIISSDSASSDEEIEVRGPIIARPRFENYQQIIALYSDEEFRQNFRMNRTTFYHALSLIRDQISTQVFDKGRHTISAEIQFQIALWYFGSPDSFRSICSRFNIGKATALRTVRRVANALFSIARDIITWPNGQRLEEITNSFNAMGFPNTIGCLDGMYVGIPKPKVHGLSYICRKSFPSLILQGICDNKLTFLHCYAGEVGSTHDASVLRRSEVWSYMLEQDKFPNDVHLIGDKAYPCLPQLITPYRDNGHLTDQQRHFNYRLSSVRSTIERAFNLLQKRFRRLKDLLDVQSLEWSSKYIIACCVLHNICIMKDDILEIELNEMEQDVEGQDHRLIRDLNRERLRLGTQKRDALCQQLNNAV